MQRHDERLHIPRSWWLLSLLTGALLGVITMPLGIIPALAGTAVGGTAAAVGLSSYGSARIRVIGDTLIAGRARIPLSALGEAHVLEPGEARAWRSHRADPRAYLLLRAYIPTAVRVEVTDPADPTPYLYLSTRRPKRLAAALRAERPAGSGTPTGTAEL